MGVAVGFEGILALARSQRKEQIVHTKVPLAFLPVTCVNISDTSS